MKTDDTKLCELIVYIARQYAEHEYFGATKLNKILFYSDFLAYRELGQSITGSEYQKLKNGPAPWRLLPVRKRLVRDGSIELKTARVGEHVEQRTLAQRTPDLSDFTEEEIGLVDQIIELSRDKSGTDLSHLSHRFHGWELAEERETIPYQSVLVGQHPPSATDIEYGKTLVPDARACTERGDRCEL